MPVYNTKEEYLREAIESILNQTYSDFELVIINDGSTNNAEEVILSYQDARIVYIKQENKGIVGALNKGWDNSQGEYIARMDSDDIAYPKRFEKQIQFFENHPEYSLVGTQAKIIGKNTVIKVPYEVRMMDLLTDCTFVHSAIMFRKSDFDKYNIHYTEDAKYAEDYLLYSKAIRFLKMANLSEIMLDYRVYPENASSSNRDLRVKSSFIVQDMILDYMSNDKKVRNSLLDLAYKKKVKTKGFMDKLFSVRNLYKNWYKYKLITIFGLELSFKVKEYQK